MCNLITFYHIFLVHTVSAKIYVMNLFGFKYDQFFRRHFNNFRAETFMELINIYSAFLIHVPSFVIATRESLDMTAEIQ